MEKYILIYDYITDPNSFSLAEKMIIPMGGTLLLFYIIIIQIATKAR